MIEKNTKNELVKFKSLKHLVGLAYKKLKGSIYYDKYQVFLRQEIVNQETEKFEDNVFVKNIEKAIWSIVTDKNNTENKYDDIEKEILDNISYRILPKGIKTEEDKAILFNSQINEKVELDKFQYFIDMQLEGHILGVIWTMFAGLALDDNQQMYEHAYANRIKKDSAFKDTPKLFNPYFQQYVDWREKALNNAKNCLSEKKDVLIITMDLSRYYYSLDVTEGDFNDINQIVNEYYKEKNVLIDAETKDGLVIDKKQFIKIIERISTTVYKIMQSYSQLLREKNSNEFNIDNTFLPIGFMPSNVLSNWKLNKFDKEIVSQLNPVYYGRYVDDILFVDKVEKNSELYNIAKGEDFEGSYNKKMDEIIQYYFVGYKRDKCKDINIKDEKKNNCIECDKSKECENYINRDILHIEKDDNKTDEGDGDGDYKRKNYSISENLLSGKSKIVLQSSKVKTFYFRNKSTSALIDCFKKQISANSSEFRMLPDLSDIFEKDDFSGFFKLINEEGVNKLRAIDKFSFDKYGASKMLGKILKGSNLFKDEKESEFLQEVISFFDTRLLIEHYTMWEKLFEILIVNNQHALFLDVVKKIRNIIDKDLITDCKENADEKYIKIKTDLKQFLKYSVYKPMSLLSEKQIKELEKSGLSSYVELQLPKIIGYRTTRMMNKHLLAFPIEFLPRDNRSICLYNFEDVFSHLEMPKQSKVVDDSFNVILPYTITPQDIAIAIQYISISKMEQLQDPKNLLEKEEYYFELFNNFRMANNNIIVDDFNKNDGSFITTIKDTKFEKKEKLRIAIGNAEVSLDRAKLIMQGNQNVSYEKYSETIKMINSAIKENADILVLPECYLPFKWISIVANHCAKNKIALVCGVEHVLSPLSPKGNKKKIYNLTVTILPYSHEDYNFAYISFHHKKHYAPSEIELIESYNHIYIEGKTYELFRWKGINFPIYCCYELASIQDRAIFANELDFLVAVEWNKDLNYYSNIIESLTRDLHCYCVQVNSADYGDSRIVQPTKKEILDIVKTKGGINRTILVGEIDIKKLRNFQKLSTMAQAKDKTFKQTPPGFDNDSPYKRGNNA